MIASGYLVLPDLSGDNTITIQKGWIEWDGPIVVRVEIGDDHPNPDLGGPESLISPGFIDTHLHLPQVDAMGAYGMQLLDWLEQVVFPAEANWADPDHAAKRTDTLLDQLISVGTTGFFAFSANFREATLAALERSKERGFRAKIGQPLTDMHIHDALIKSVQENMDDARTTIEKFPESSTSRVAAAIAPRFALTCSSELLEACGVLVTDTGAYLETHLAEMEPECVLACERHQASDYTAIYEQAGLLGPRSFFGHGIYLSDSEQARLAASGSVIAHCPTSNTFLRSGTMNRRHYETIGLATSLASDIAGGPDKSMIRVARAMMEASFHVDAEPAPSLEAWWQITQGNAERLGWNSAGIIREGADADLVVIQPHPDWLTARDPLGYVIFGWDDRWLEQTILRGKPVL